MFIVERRKRNSGEPWRRVAHGIRSKREATKWAQDEWEASIDNGDEQEYRIVEAQGE